MALARALVRRALEIPRRGLPKLARELTDDFDQRYGVETALSVQLVVASSPNLALGVRYETTSEDGIRWCIDNSGLDPQTTTFLDIGCGKGRVLIVAAQYPFSRIVGVEYSAELCAICERNLRAIQGLERCTVVNKDAEHFALPDGDLLVYMFNPFKPELARKVLARLANHPGKLELAYRGPGLETVQDTGLFDEVARGRAATARIFTPRRAGGETGLCGAVAGGASGADASDATRRRSTPKAAQATGWRGAGKRAQECSRPLPC
jgi:SAM-dependent methyltransferase